MSFEQLPAAPAFEVAGWAEAPPALDAARPRLVVAWTTWCPTCTAETPTLNALYKKYQGKIDFVALSDEPIGDLTSQAQQRSVSVRRVFPVAADSDVDTMHVYGRAVGEAKVTLPKAWLVHRGKILWHGSPADAQPAVDEVLSTRDAAVARKARARIAALGAAYQNAFAEGGSAAASAQADQLLTAATGYGYTTILLVARLLDGESKPDTAFAVKLAKLANDASFNADYTHLSILAMAQWDNGERAEARETQARSVMLCRDLKGDCENVETQLAQYRTLGE
ncbi:MAG: TlpA disulfide reductase family protein [Polyangiaceae bacterium]